MPPFRAYGIFGIIRTFMKKLGLLSIVALLSLGARASWYWPFGSKEGDEPVRISKLIEPASLLIDEATDLASDGKVDDAVEKYRKALLELDRIEAENPERAKSSEFATVRNKRAYVNAAIDSMLLGQVKNNAKAVAVSDTTALEKRLAEERGEKKVEKRNGEGEKNVEKKGGGREKKVESAKPLAKREQAMRDIAAGDYGSAELVINEMLVEKPNGAAALNLKAALEAKRGNFKEAEHALDQAIMFNPRSHSAYYNMAVLLLQMDGSNKGAAKRFYETGRAMGGAADEDLEKRFR